LQFAPDTIDTLGFTVALANTVPGASRSGTDELSTQAQLTALLAEHSYTGRFDRDLTELAEVVDTRTLLRHIWTHSRDKAVPVVNRLLREANALPHLVRHDGWDWHLHATEGSAPLAERIRVEVAFALIDVIRAREWDRLRGCAASDCTGLFVDLSRNGSKRFCSIRCGNRMNMVEHRARVASAG
jgi:predicted RNA-binding Zn ribbon-like protein